MPCNSLFGEFSNHAPSVPRIGSESTETLTMVRHTTSFFTVSVFNLSIEYNRTFSVENYQSLVYSSDLLSYYLMFITAFLSLFLSEKLPLTHEINIISTKFNMIFIKHWVIQKINHSDCKLYAFNTIICSYVLCVFVQLPFLFDAM